MQGSEFRVFIFVFLTDTHILGLMRGEHLKFSFFNLLLPEIHLIIIKKGQNENLFPSPRVCGVRFQLLRKH